MTKTRRALLLAAAALLFLPPLRAAAEGQLSYRFAGREEGAALLSGNDEYIRRLTQNDLDFRLGRSGATAEDWRRFAAGQVRDFTEEEAETIRQTMADLEATLARGGYALPRTDEIVFVNTTQREEGGSEGYTHGSAIFLDGELMRGGPSPERKFLLAHEIFHCLTRSNPDFRAAMYGIIHFSVREEEFEIGPDILACSLTNPDVERRDASARFRIDGEERECCMALVTTRRFRAGDDGFAALMQPVLIPVDEPDACFTPEQAENFWDVLGRNTTYVLDPEECLADNFALALTYGRDGADGAGYEDPEIIEAMLELLKAPPHRTAARQAMPFPPSVPANFSTCNQQACEICMHI